MLNRQEHQLKLLNNCCVWSMNQYQMFLSLLFSFFVLNISRWVSRYVGHVLCWYLGCCCMIRSCSKEWVDTELVWECASTVSNATHIKHSFAHVSLEKFMYFKYRNVLTSDEYHSQEDVTWFVWAWTLSVIKHLGQWTAVHISSLIYDTHL